MKITYSFEAVLDKIYPRTKFGHLEVRRLIGNTSTLMLKNIPVATIEKRSGNKVKIEMKTRGGNAIEVARIVGALFEKHGFTVNLNVN